MIELRLPNITTADPKGQLEQIKSYLYQLTGELQWALNTVERGTQEALESISLPKSVKPGSPEAEASFNEIKALIIKSADVVNAYYEVMNAAFSSEYLAQSDFGTYFEEKLATYEIGSDGIAAFFESVQTLSGEVATLLKSKGYIKAGDLGTDDNGNPIIGLEIGQNLEENEEETSRTWARFTSDRLSFYNSVGTEIAWISGEKLYIEAAEFTGGIKMGGYQVDTTYGLAFFWAGREEA